MRFARTGQPVVLWLCWLALGEDRLVTAGAVGDCPEHGIRDCVEVYYASRRLAGMGRMHLLRMRKRWRRATT